MSSPKDNRSSLSYRDSVADRRSKAQLRSESLRDIRATALAVIVSLEFLISAVLFIWALFQFLMGYSVEAIFFVVVLAWPLWILGKRIIEKLFPIRTGYEDDGNAVAVSEHARIEVAVALTPKAVRARQTNPTGRTGTTARFRPIVSPPLIAPSEMTLATKKEAMRRWRRLRWKNGFGAVGNFIASALFAVILGFGALWVYRPIMMAQLFFSCSGSVEF